MSAIKELREKLAALVAAQKAGFDRLTPQVKMWADISLKDAPSLQAEGVEDGSYTIVFNINANAAPTVEVVARGPGAERGSKV